jgi:hypothetical protein
MVKFLKLCLLVSLFGFIINNGCETKQEQYEDELLDPLNKMTDIDTTVVGDTLQFKPYIPNPAKYSEEYINPNYRIP